MDDNNGKIEFGEIIANQRNHTIILSEIKSTLEKITDDVNQSKIDINGIGIKTNSVQNGLTEHKEEHKYVLGTTITIASIFGGIVAWIISYFKGTK